VKDTVVPHRILPGIDRAAFATGLAVRLRTAGVAVGLSGVDAFAAALAAAPPGTRSDLYWSARITLVRDRAELAAFDAVFAAVFADAVLGTDPHARRRALPGARAGERPAGSPTTSGDADGAALPWATLPRVTATDEPGGTTVVPLRLPSALAGLADTPFEDLDAADM
jgi:uncharacterized protein with von Willebrand factor type A (vWA) domain